MAFQRQDALRSIAALVLVSLLGLPALAEENHPARLRQLAAELAERLGEDKVELLADATPVEIERIGLRADDPPARFPSRIAADEIVAAMNRERARYGLEPLRLEQRLSLAAGDRIQDMMELRYFAHVSPDGREPFETILDRGYDFRDAGENLAAGFASANAVVRAWMKSPAHRDNILSPAFDEVGIAISADPPKPAMRGHLFVALYGAE